ncbi:MAG: glycosyltransferase family 4 protein [Candidatus Verstraetearchaeota archaeon]|nr:glycosyltransferase family 4 protein [Candidatus Verstraetearchaeota archaeon]
MVAYGGAAAAVAHLSAYLTSKGVENKILALVATDNFIKATRSLDIDVYSKSIISTYDYLRKEDIFRKIISTISGGLILRSYVKMFSGNFDIINPHNFPASWASILHKKPVVWMMNEPPDVYSLTVPRWFDLIRNIGIKIDSYLVRNYIDQICVNSFVTYRQALQRYRKKANVVLFGIDYNRYSNGFPDKIIEKYKLKDRFIILTAGMLSPSKNQLASIKAIEVVRKYIPNVILVLAGGGETNYVNMLKEYVKFKKLEKYVIFTGFLSGNDIINMYHACDIGLYPFREQGGLLAPFENLCAGKPVIVSPSNGAAELIKRYDLGIVTHNYAEAIINIYNNYSYYLKKAQRAKEIVKTQFSWEKYGERLLRVFEKCYNSTSVDELCRKSLYPHEGKGTRYE